MQAQRLGEQIFGVQRACDLNFRDELMSAATVSDMQASA
jgi:hypothetical protein